METIETAMFVVVLDEEEPRSESEVSQKLMTGLPVNRLMKLVQAGFSTSALFMHLKTKLVVLTATSMRSMKLFIKITRMIK